MPVPNFSFFDLLFFIGCIPAGILIGTCVFITIGEFYRESMLPIRIKIVVTYLIGFIISIVILLLIIYLIPLLIPIKYNKSMNYGLFVGIIIGYAYLGNKFVGS